jgi:hypothetical protein
MHEFRSVSIYLCLFGKLLQYRISHRYLIILVRFLWGMLVGFLKNSLMLLLPLPDLGLFPTLTPLVRYTDH